MRDKEIEMTTVELKDIPRKDLEIFIYEEHKTAYGVKGRHYDFAQMSREQLEREADRIADACDEAIAAEKAAEKAALDRFESMVSDNLALGAPSRDDAIRWILLSERLDSEYDAGYICYCLGLSYDMKEVFKPFTVSFETKYGEVH
tara:strand:+ start:20657 stop:21094 length:438 start_codon:yes stop_codon:yes gene_type:complete